MLTLQAKQQFQRDGYVVIEDAVSETLTKELRREAEILTETEEKDESFVFNGLCFAEEWTTCLPNYSAFKQIFNCPKLIDLVQQLLDAPCELVLSALDLIAPGQGIDIWHQDEDVSNGQIGITVSLHDINTSEEILKVVPESNGWPAPLEDQFYQSFPNEVHLNIYSHTAIIQDPLLWHATQINTSGEKKWLLFLYYKIVDPTNV